MVVLPKPPRPVCWGRGLEVDEEIMLEGWEGRMVLGGRGLVVDFEVRIVLPAPPRPIRAVTVVVEGMIGSNPISGERRGG